LIALGLWGDGVPCNWDRTESVETVCLDLPGQEGEFDKLRIPLVGLSNKQVTSETWEDIFEVLSWSFGCAGTGNFPASRHDLTAWLPSDKKHGLNRRKLAGKPLGAQGALVQVRGDWDFFAKVFNFPKHNTLAGCCWKCNCAPSQVYLRSSNTHTRSFEFEPCTGTQERNVFCFQIRKQKRFELCMFELWNFEVSKFGTSKLRIVELRSFESRNFKVSNF
jgi:hypothetical protein